MQIYFGNVNIDGAYSSLDPPGALLLLAGFPDHQQAAVAATNFIVNVKQIPNGTPVAVLGTSTQVGAQAAIVMTDINRSHGLEQHAAQALAAGPVPKKTAKKKAHKK